MVTYEKLVWFELKLSNYSLELLSTINVNFYDLANNIINYNKLYNH